MFSLPLTETNCYFFRFYTTPFWTFTCNDTATCSQLNRRSYFKSFLPQHHLFTFFWRNPHTRSSRVHMRIYPSFRLPGISVREMLSSTYVRVEERRFLASCRELRRRAEATAEEAATGNDERIFQLAAPAEMRRLCLSINMRRDKATRSFIRSFAAA